MTASMLNFLSVLLDATALSLCTLAVFRNKRQIRRKDCLLLPLVLLCFLLARTNFTVGTVHPVFQLEQGFSFAPADNILLFLILLIGVLLLSSTLLQIEDGKQAFCGTMASFSVYLFCRFAAAFLLTLCSSQDTVMLIGSSILTLLFVTFLVSMPGFDTLREILQTGTFLVQLVSSNIALFFMVVLCIISFDMERFTEHLYSVGIALLLLLLLDSILLYLNAQKEEERKRVHMIEQYVPIVEELISQVRARQHEFNNRMMAMEAAVSSAQSLSEAQKSVATLTQGLTLCPTDSALLACDSKIVSGLIYGKIKQADLSGIAIHLELGGCFKKTSVPETVWIEIIGILLDNAMEASKCGDTIYLQSRQMDRVLELYVSNPYLPMSGTEFMNLFRRGVSTKSGGSRGYGLYQLMRLTEHYKGKIITRNETHDGKNYVVFGVQFS